MLPFPGSPGFIREVPACNACEARDGNVYFRCVWPARDPKMDFLKPTAEHLALYAQFWIEFLCSPASTLKEFKASGKIQPQLIIFLSISLLVSWVIGYVASLIGVPDDPSPSFQWAKGIGYNDIPKLGLALTFVTLLVSAVFHAVVHLVDLLGRLADKVANKAPEAHLGNVYDTINGALGFVAFFMPLSIFVLASMLVATQNGVGTQHPYFLVLFPVLLAILLYVYMLSALAAIHPQTRRGGVFISFSTAFVLIYLLFELLGFVLR